MEDNATASHAPILKLGIVSDSQGYDYPEDWGYSNLEKAFAVLAGKGIDVLLNAGDTGDHGDDDTAIRYYEGLVRKHFAAKLPAHVACLGNHDYWTHDGNRTQRECLDQFCDAIGAPRDQIVRATVKGYDFIALSSDNVHSYDAEDCEKLRPVLEEAVRRDPSKPVFVVTHFHPSGTVEGSRGSSGRPALRALLNDFPQVVSLSGHTHVPLNDERCIWQGEFTALNTSGLSYCCVQGNFANCCGPIPPFAREGLFFMYAEIFADRIEFHRYNAEDGEEIGKALWTVALPYDPAKAAYTDARADGREAPAFPPDAQFLFRYDYGFCYLVFDGAVHPDFVDHYRVAATELDDAGNAVRAFEWRYVNNYYRIAKNRDPRQVLRFPPNTLEKDRRYRFEVFPAESFGKEGKPLSMTLRIRPRYGFRNLAEIGPQE